MNKLKLFLKQEWLLLKEARNIFLYSVESCAEYAEENKNYSLQDADKMEAYTSRFARLLDIYIQKILRLIDKINLNDTGTLRDIIYRAEKRGLIANAEKLIQLKIYRNEIAHDYIPSNVRNIFFEIKAHQQFLLETISLTENYVEALLNE